MVETRRHFHEQLGEIEALVLQMGESSRSLFQRALDAIESQDLADCDAVIQGDDVVDRFYMQIERAVVELFALQGPVASDLRFLAAMLHVNLHLERIADMGVNVAKIAKAAFGLPRNPSVLAQLKDMGAIAVAMLAVAMDSFARRDVELARELPGMDEPLDNLNRGMLAEILTRSADKRMLEWGVHMHVVARQIERVGDHAVDIGEQVAYVVTGAFQEFTGASDLEGGAKLTEPGH